MLTNLTFFKRRPGLGVDGFCRYWQTTHRDLALRLPGLRHYVQHATDASGYRKGEPVYDGVAATTWDGIDALRELRGTAAVADVYADEPNLMDMTSRTEIVTEDDVIVDGAPPADALTMLVFLNRRPDLSPDAFHAHWRDVHGPLGAAVPGMIRYVQHHTIANLYAGGREPVYDGVAQTWFADLGSMRAAAGTAQRAATADDEPNFVAGRPPFVVSTSIVMR